MSIDSPQQVLDPEIYVGHGRHASHLMPTMQPFREPGNNDMLLARDKAEVCMLSELNQNMFLLQVVDAQTLEPVEDARKQPTVIAIAAFFGSVRLIDNLEIDCTSQTNIRD